MTDGDAARVRESHAIVLKALADIRGIEHHPRAASPVRRWGFFADCSLHVVHDEQLWIVDNERRATKLGTVELWPRPVVFAGRTLSELSSRQ